MRYLEAWTEKRRLNAAFYQNALAGVRGLQLPVDKQFEKAVYHTFVVQAECRDELRQHLADNGVETAVHYPVPIHLLKAASNLGYGPGSFPVVEYQAKRTLSLPVHQELTNSDLEYIASTVRNFYGT